MENKPHTKTVRYRTYISYIGRNSVATIEYPSDPTNCYFFSTPVWSEKHGFVDSVAVTHKGNVHKIIGTNKYTEVEVDTRTVRERVAELRSKNAATVAAAKIG